MPIKISELDAATTLLGPEIVPIVQSSATVRTTVAAFQAYVESVALVLESTLSVAGATTLSAALTYGGVTLSNAVTGTGNMVLSASPTLTGTLAAASGTFSGTLGVTGNTTLTGDLAVNGGDQTSTATTFNLLNATVTTLNLGGAATTIAIGAATGTCTLGPALVGSIATDSVSSTTGAWKTAGGLGVAKAAFIGTTLNVGTTFSVTGTGAVAAAATFNSATSGQEVVKIVHSHATVPAGIVVTYTGGAPNSTTCDFLSCSDTGGLRAAIDSNGGLANYQANNVNLSDAKLKTALTPLGKSWHTWKKFKFGTYLYKDQTDQIPNIGVLADDVELAAPHLVTNVELQPRLIHELNQPTIPNEESGED